jgi:alpha-tubulin suppressor-like RCC1 family protein
MKRLLILLLPFFASAQSNKYGPGEYEIFGIGPDGLPYGCSSTYGNLGVNNTGTKGTFLRVVTSPTNLQFAKIYGGLHGGAGIDVNGFAWTMGSNSTCELGAGDNTGRAVAFKVAFDSAGNDFSGITQLAPFFTSNAYNGWFAVKNDGSLWVWGAPTSGIRGVGTIGPTCSKPVLIPMGGRAVTQILGGDIAIALCSDGSVWTWGETNGANLGYVGSGIAYQSPHQVTFPNGTLIGQIAGGRNFHFAANAAGDTLYGWGKWGNYLGGINSGPFPSGTGLQVTTPVNLKDSVLAFLDGPVYRMVTHHNGVHFITVPRTLWYMGDNAQGGAGNGQEKNFTDTTGGKIPYAWSGNAGDLIIKHPVKISNKSDWKWIWGGSTFNMSIIAIDSKDSAFTWGRNKAVALGNGILSCDASGNLESRYGNSWDVLNPTPIHPFSNLGVWTSTCPGCINGLATTYCSNCSLPVNIKPVANAGTTQNITVTTTNLNGNASTDNVHISAYLWSQISGPNTAKFDLVASSAPALTNLTTGTYVFKLKVTDNEWLTDSNNVTVNVNLSSASASAGPDQSITLPTSSVTLNGTGSTGVTTSLWSQISGPGTATIVSPANLTTSVTGLVQGTYIFQILINGSLTDQVTITVNPQPSAQAGDDQEIVFPQSSVSLDGSNSIGATSYAWTQISGPNTGNIATPTTVGTFVSGLIPGVYVFQLSINGGVSTDQITVTVDVGCQVPNCIIRGIFKPKN